MKDTKKERILKRIIYKLQMDLTLTKEENKLIDMILEIKEVK